MVFSSLQQMYLMSKIHFESSLVKNSNVAFLIQILLSDFNLQFMGPLSSDIAFLWETVHQDKIFYLLKLIILEKKFKLFIF